MKDLYIKDLKKGQVVDDFYLGVGSVKESKDKNNNPYYDVELVDMTGVIKGKIWSDRFDSIQHKALDPGAVVKVSGNINEFRGELQLIIQSLFALERDQYNVKDFLQTSVYDLDQMWDELNEFISKIENQKLKSLIEKVMDKYGEKYKMAPAAERLHHGFLGGMVEHVLELLKLMEPMRALYPEANYDLITVGIILHDIGKIRELDSEGFSIERTDEGKLIGHLPLSFEIFLECLPEGFDKDLKMRIGHIILSHHGLIEYGSPVLPKTLEAIIVHQLDNLSSTVRQYKRVIDESDDEASFSKRDWALNTDVYLK